MRWPKWRLDQAPSAASSASPQFEGCLQPPRMNLFEVRSIQLLWSQTRPLSQAMMVARATNDPFVANLRKLVFQPRQKRVRLRLAP